MPDQSNAMTRAAAPAMLRRVCSLLVSLQYPPRQVRHRSTSREQEDGPPSRYVITWRSTFLQSRVFVRQQAPQ